MGVTDSFQFTSAHAHTNLLGWVSLALSGIIYYYFPLAGENKTAKIHFWLMMIGVPLLLFSMILFGLGRHELAEPISGVGRVLILIAVLLFMVNVMKNVKAKAR